MVDHRISTGLICYAHLFFLIKQFETKTLRSTTQLKKKTKQKKRKKSKPAHLLLTLSGCCLEL